TGDDASLGRAEDLPDLRLAKSDLLVDRLQHALQCCLDLVDRGVDHRVVADVYALAVSELRGLALRPYVEAHDDGVGGSSQRDVGLGDSTNTTIDNPQTDLVADVDLGQRIFKSLHRAGTVALEDETQFLRLALLELLEQLVECLASRAGGLSGHPQPCCPPFGDLPRHAIVINHQEAVPSTGHGR